LLSSSWGKAISQVENYYALNKSFKRYVDQGFDLNREFFDKTGDVNFLLLGDLKNQLDVEQRKRVDSIDDSKKYVMILKEF